MQDQFMKMQEQMKELKITGSSPGGLVEVTLNGDYQLLDLKINPECVDPEDVDGLTDLIKAAFSDAQKKVKENGPGELPSNLSGLAGMPGFPGLNF